MVLRFIIPLLILFISETLSAQEQSFGLNEKHGEFLPENIFIYNETGQPHEVYTGGCPYKK